MAMTTTRQSAVEEYRNARALLADAMRRDDQAAREVARPIYIAAVERLKLEDVCRGR